MAPFNAGGSASLSESISPFVSPDCESATISPAPSTSLPMSHSITLDPSSTSLSGALALVTSSAMLSPLLSPQLSPGVSPRAHPQPALASSSASEIHELLACATNLLKSSMDSMGTTPVIGQLQQEDQPAAPKTLALPRVLANRPKAYHRQLVDAAEQSPSRSSPNVFGTAVASPYSSTPSSPSTSSKSSVRSDTESEVDWRVREEEEEQELQSLVDSSTC